MIRNEKLEDISDGRLYDANDMVKAYCDECKVPCLLHRDGEFHHP